MSLPRAVLFDLDDTLISAYSRADAAWLAVCSEFTEKIAPLTPTELAKAVNDVARLFWSDPDRHREWRLKLNFSRREIVRLAFEELSRQGRVPSLQVTETLADRFTAYRNEQMKLFPHAHEVVDYFRGRGVKLALITNGAAEDQRAKVLRFDLQHRFDHIQIEGEHGFGKPEEQAYRHALASLGVEPHETWIIGDNLEWEVRAPQKLGLYCIWHDVMGEGVPAGVDVRPDRIIRSLGELLPAKAPA